MNFVSPNHFATFVLLSALCAMVVGGLVLGANPTRLTNQIFAAIGVLFAVCMVFLHKAIGVGMRYPLDPAASPIPWLRAYSATGAFAPWLLWCLRESIGSPTIERAEILRKL